MIINVYNKDTGEIYSELPVEFLPPINTYLTISVFKHKNGNRFIDFVDNDEDKIDKVLISGIVLGYSFDYKDRGYGYDDDNIKKRQYEYSYEVIIGRDLKV